MATVPQRPDGDATALLRFDIHYDGSSAPHQVRSMFWYNLAGALFAWGLLDRLWWSASAVVRRRLRGAGSWGVLLLWAGLLVMWGGWAWNQSRGWQGELYLEPGAPLALGVDRTPEVAFSHFLIPPAAEGTGRALALRLLVDGEAHDVSEAEPYRRAGWTVRPLWFGATVQSRAFAEPVSLGGSGSQRVALRWGGHTTVEVDVETLEARSTIPLADMKVTRHAILTACFAPGDPLQRSGAAMLALGALLSMGRMRYNRQLFTRERREVQCSR
jgi:hypothetical protein